MHNCLGVVQGAPNMNLNTNKILKW